MKEKHRASQPKKQNGRADPPKKIMQTPGPRADIAVEKFGPPGIKGELHVVPIFPHDPRSDLARLQDHSERDFIVSALLLKSPASTGNIKGDFNENDGGSYLTPPQGTETLQAETLHGSFEVLKNHSGELSFLRFTCRATSISDARDRFQLAALPFLDKLSFIANCPLVVGPTRIEDRQNQCTTLEYISPYRKATINPHRATIYPEMAPVYAMYREAQNSHSDFYKFLCYYKLLEGMFAHLRANTFKLARERNITIDTVKDAVPASEHIPEMFRQYAGKSVKSFFDSVMTPEFRNAVAHFVTDDGSVLNMSSPAHVDRYSNILFISELCVRETIDNQEHLLGQLYGASADTPAQKGPEVCSN
ncbi:hypothetical protein RA280_31335 [Cupriavidus sp. CV2]|uniref:methylamine utilization protein MauJ n=1 Tax=Cupriavidus ulmosensis TaxID=3065913 RepID=UPI00296AC45B|nr:methylamine utilization protein MauJ [Cupriavidus sp. CV2]MDW3686156.1 hypothetical protein [Cupriavidus sp. CV2]